MCVLFIAGLKKKAPAVSGMCFIYLFRVSVSGVAFRRHVLWSLPYGFLCPHDFCSGPGLLSQGPQHVV